MRVALGVPGLDDVLGGLDPGSLVVVRGPSGSGKTIMALQYVYANASEGRRAMLFSFLEDDRRLVDYAARLGMDLASLIKEGVLQIASVPVSASADYLESLASILHRIAEEGYVAVALDGISTFIPGIPQAKLVGYFRNIVYSLFHRSKATGLITMDLALSGIFPWIDIIGDVLIELGYELGLTATYPRRLMRLIKTRGKVPESHVLEFSIGAGGLKAYPLRPMKPGKLDLNRVFKTGVEPIDKAAWGLVEGSLALVEGSSGSGKTLILRMIHAEAPASCYVSLKGVVDGFMGRGCVESLALWNRTPLEIAYRIADLAEKHSPILIDNMELVYTDYGRDALHAFIKALYGMRGRSTLLAALNTDVMPTSLRGLVELYFDYVFRAQRMREEVSLEPVKTLGVARYEEK